MKIRQSKKRNTHLLIDVPQSDFRYWDGFCEFFINKCEYVIENSTLDKAEFRHFQAIKENLEMILFTIDVNQTDNHTVFEFDSKYVTFFALMKEQWIALLQQNIQVQKERLMSVKNGENKRQLFDEVEKNTYFVATGARVLAEFTKMK